jgi:hypothetical protein
MAAFTASLPMKRVKASLFQGLVAEFHSMSLLETVELINGSMTSVGSLLPWIRRRKYISSVVIADIYFILLL